MKCLVICSYLVGKPLDTVPVQKSNRIRLADGVYSCTLEYL